MSSITKHGYFVIADISGYTSYVAQTELEHSHEILAELLELLVNRFTSLMVISKLEGDAVFAYAEESAFARGETLLEFIESIYVTFRDRQLSMRRKTTCSCRACQNIPSLDLKFVAHHGDYIIQNIASVREMVGSDVNLIHRLLKNHVSEATGWRAYIMFTERCLARLNFSLENAHMQMEDYDHLGEVQTLSIDLHARHREIMDARRVVIPPEEAHSIFEYDYNAAPEVLWDWFNDPHKRGQWMTSEIIPVLRVHGRSGAGARNHCVHGNNQIVVEDVLDMRPYDYFTVSHVPQGTSMALQMTFAFQPIDSGKTRLRLLFKVHARFLPNWVRKQLCKIILRVQIFKLWKFESIDRLMANGNATFLP